MTLTPKQIRNLHTAIERAEGFDKCKYTRGGQPRCVIGQLAALEGVPVEVMKKWDTYTAANTVEDIYNEDDAAPLRKYPLTLLAELQTAWDDSFYGRYEDYQKVAEIDARTYMTSLVEASR
jgi:hypothetical protein